MGDAVSKEKKKIIIRKKKTNAATPNKTLYNSGTFCADFPDTVQGFLNPMGC